VTLGGIDLQGILDDSPTLGAPAATDEEPAAAEPPAATGSLDAVFKKMRRQAGQGAGESGAQDLALAETYVEMGMNDEALTALESAVRSPRHRFRAATLLARLYKKQGEITQAIEWMERATQAPPPVPEDGHALLYELGVTLEGQGETARALAVFLELQAEAGDYRDVASRVDRLARVQAGG
jgi:Tfp pilus assembly protein PilF